MGTVANREGRPQTIKQRDTGASEETETMPREENLKKLPLIPSFKPGGCCTGRNRMHKKETLQASNKLCVLKTQQQVRREGRRNRSESERQGIGNRGKKKLAGQSKNFNIQIIKASGKNRGKRTQGNNLNEIFEDKSQDVSFHTEGA